MKVNYMPNGGYFWRNVKILGSSMIPLFRFPYVSAGRSVVIGGRRERRYMQGLIYYKILIL